MTTTDVTASTILALDLGKYKSVACDYQRDSALAAFGSITTSRASFPRFVAKRRNGSQSRRRNGGPWGI